MTMTDIHGIIFDLDGTLIDTETLSDKAVMMSIRGLSDAIKIDRYNYKLPWELKKQILGLRGSEWAPIVLNYAAQHWNVPYNPTTTLPSVSSSLTVDPIANQLWIDWDINLSILCEQEVKACPGASELVELIATHYPTIPMAIATSSRSDSYDKKRNCLARIQQQQEQHNNQSNSGSKNSMLECISVVVCGNHPNVLRGKPAPDIYLEAAKQINIPISKCLVFEDAVSGIRSAKSAGCAAVVAIPDPRYEPQELQSLFQQEADIVLQSLTEFDGTQFGLPLLQLSQKEE